MANQRYILSTNTAKDTLEREHVEKALRRRAINIALDREQKKHHGDVSIARKGEKIRYDDMTDQDRMEWAATHKRLVDAQLSRLKRSPVGLDADGVKRVVTTATDHYILSKDAYKPNFRQDTRSPYLMQRAVTAYRDMADSLQNSLFRGVRQDNEYFKYRAESQKIEVQAANYNAVQTYDQVKSALKNIDKNHGLVMMYDTETTGGSVNTTDKYGGIRKQQITEINFSLMNLNKTGEDGLTPKVEETFNSIIGTNEEQDKHLADLIDDYRNGRRTFGQDEIVTLNRLNLMGYRDNTDPSKGTQTTLGAVMGPDYERAKKGIFRYTSFAGKEKAMAMDIDAMERGRADLRQIGKLQAERLTDWKLASGKTVKVNGWELETLRAFQRIQKDNLTVAGHNIIPFDNPKVNLLINNMSVEARSAAFEILGKESFDPEYMLDTLGMIHNGVDVMGTFRAMAEDAGTPEQAMAAKDAIDKMLAGKFTSNQLEVLVPYLAPGFYDNRPAHMANTDSEANGLLLKATKNFYEQAAAGKTSTEFMASDSLPSYMGAHSFELEGDSKQLFIFKGGSSPDRYNLFGFAGDNLNGTLHTFDGIRLDGKDSYQTLFRQRGPMADVAYTIEDIQAITLTDKGVETLSNYDPRVASRDLVQMTLRPVSNLPKDSAPYKANSEITIFGYREDLQRYVMDHFAHAGDWDEKEKTWTTAGLDQYELDQLQTVYSDTPDAHLYKQAAKAKAKGKTPKSNIRTEEFDINRAIEKSDYRLQNESGSRMTRQFSLKKDLAALRFIDDRQAYVEKAIQKAGAKDEAAKEKVARKAIDDFHRKVRQDSEAYSSSLREGKAPSAAKTKDAQTFQNYFGWTVNEYEKDGSPKKRPNKLKGKQVVFQETVDAQMARVTSANPGESYIERNRDLIEAAAKKAEERVAKMGLEDSKQAEAVKEKYYYLYMHGLYDAAQLRFGEHSEEAGFTKWYGQYKMRLGRFDIDMSNFQGVPVEKIDQPFQLNIRGEGLGVADSLARYLGYTKPRIDSMGSYEKKALVMKLQDYLIDQGIIENSEKYQITQEQDLHLASKNLVDQLRKAQQNDPTAGILHDSAQFQILTGKKNFGLSEEEVDTALADLDARLPQIEIMQTRGKDEAANQKLDKESRAQAKTAVDKALFQNVTDDELRNEGFMEEEITYAKKARQIRRQDTEKFVGEMFSALRRHGVGVSYSEENHAIFANINGKDIKLDLPTDRFENGTFVTKLGSFNTLSPVGLYETREGDVRVMSLLGKAVSETGNIGYAIDNAFNRTDGSNDLEGELRRYCSRLNAVMRKASAAQDLDTQNWSDQFNFSYKDAIKHLHELYETDETLREDIASSKKGEKLKEALTAKTKYGDAIPLDPDNIDFDVRMAINENMNAIQHAFIRHYGKNSDGTSVGYGDLMATADLEIKKTYSFQGRGVDTGEFFWEVSGNRSRGVGEAISHAYSFDVDEAEKNMKWYGGISFGRSLSYADVNAHNTAAKGFYGRNFDKIARLNSVTIQSEDVSAIVDAAYQNKEEWLGKDAEEMTAGVYNMLSMMNTYEGSATMSGQVFDYVFHNHASDQFVKTVDIAESPEGDNKTRTIHNKANIRSTYDEANGTFKFRYGKGAYVKLGDTIGYRFDTLRQEKVPVPAKYNGVLKIGYFNDAKMLIDENSLNQTIMSDEETRNKLDQIKAANDAAQQALDQEYEKKKQDVIAKYRHDDKKRRTEVARLEREAKKQKEDRLQEARMQAEAVAKDLLNSKYKKQFYIENETVNTHEKIVENAEKGMTNALLSGLGGTYDPRLDDQTSIGYRIGNVAEELGLDRGQVLSLDNLKSFKANKIKDTTLGVLIDGMRKRKGLKRISENEITQIMQDNGFKSREDFFNAALEERYKPSDMLTKIFQHVGFLHPDEYFQFLSGHGLKGAKKHDDVFIGDNLASNLIKKYAIDKGEGQAGAQKAYDMIKDYLPQNTVLKKNGENSWQIVLTDRHIGEKATKHVLNTGALYDIAKREFGEDSAEKMFRNVREFTIKDKDGQDHKIVADVATHEFAQIPAYDLEKDKTMKVTYRHQQNLQMIQGGRYAVSDKDKNRYYLDGTKTWGELADAGVDIGVNDRNASAWTVSGLVHKGLSDSVGEERAEELFGRYIAPKYNEETGKGEVIGQGIINQFRRSIYMRKGDKKVMQAVVDDNGNIVGRNVGDVANEEQYRKLIDDRDAAKADLEAARDEYRVFKNKWGSKLGKKDLPDDLAEQKQYYQDVISDASQRYDESRSKITGITKFIHDEGLSSDAWTSHDAEGNVVSDENGNSNAAIRQIHSIIDDAREHGITNMGTSALRDRLQLYHTQLAVDFNSKKAHIGLSDLRYEGFQTVNILDAISDTRGTAGLKESLYGKSLIIDLKNDLTGTQLYDPEGTGSEEGRYLALPYTPTKAAGDWDYQHSEAANRSAYQKTFQSIQRTMARYQEGLNASGASGQPSSLEDRAKMISSLRASVDQVKTDIANEYGAKDGILAKAATGEVGNASRELSHALMPGDSWNNGYLSNLSFDGLNLKDEFAKGEKALALDVSIQNTKRMRNAYEDVFNELGDLGLSKSVIGNLRKNVYDIAQTEGVEAINIREPVQYAGSVGPTRLYFSDALNQDDATYHIKLGQAVRKEDNDSDQTGMALQRFESKLTIGDKKYAIDLDSATYKALSDMAASNKSLGLSVELTAQGQKDMNDSLALQYYNAAYRNKLYDTPAEEGRDTTYAHYGDTFSINGKNYGRESFFSEADENRLNKVYSDLESGAQKQYDADHGEGAFAALDKGARRNEVASYAETLAPTKTGKDGVQEMVDRTAAINFNLQKDLQVKTLDAQSAKVGAGIMNWNTQRFLRTAVASEAFDDQQLQNIMQVTTALQEGFLSAKNEKGSGDARKMETIRGAFQDMYNAMQGNMSTDQKLEVQKNVDDVLEGALIAGGGRMEKEFAKLPGMDIVERDATAEVENQGLSGADAAACIQERKEAHAKAAIHDYTSSVMKINAHGVNIMALGLGTTRGKDGDRVWENGVTEGMEETSFIGETAAMTGEIRHKQGLTIPANQSADIRENKLADQEEEYAERQRRLQEEKKRYADAAHAQRARDTEHDFVNEVAKAKNTALNAARHIHIGGKKGALLSIAGGLMLSGYTSNPGGPPPDNRQDRPIQTAQDPSSSRPMPADDQAAGQQDSLNQVAQMAGLGQPVSLSDSNLNAMRSGTNQTYVINMSANSPSGQQAAASALQSAIGGSMLNNASVNVSMNTSFADKISQLQLDKMVAHTLAGQ